LKRESYISPWEHGTFVVLFFDWDFLHPLLPLLFFLARLVPFDTFLTKERIRPVGSFEVLWKGFYDEQIPVKCAATCNGCEHVSATTKRTNLGSTTNPFTSRCADVTSDNRINHGKHSKRKREAIAKRISTNGKPKDGREETNCVVDQSRTE
jgi:hypothetical protein